MVEEEEVVVVLVAVVGMGGDGEGEVGVGDGGVGDVGDKQNLMGIGLGTCMRREVDIMGNIKWESLQNAWVEEGVEA